MGGPEVLDEARSLGGAVAEAVDALGEVYDLLQALLQAYGVADRVILDLGEVRGMDYYTGITFRGVAPGLGWPVLSGGRYDTSLCAAVPTRSVWLGSGASGRKGTGSRWMCWVERVPSYWPTLAVGTSLAS